MKLIVHIGAHKTATTHLQMRLERARLQLLELGVDFVGPASTRGERIKLSSILGHPGRWPGAERFWKKRLDAKAGIGRLVLSDENCLGGMAPGELTDEAGRLYPNAGARLKALFALIGREPASIALSIREPASFLTSAFGMWLLGGRGYHPEEFLGGVDPRIVRWSEFTQRIVEETGTPRLSIWRFEDYPRDRDKVISRLIGPTRLSAVRGRPKALIGLSQAAYDAFLARAAGTQDRGERSRIVREARKEFPRDDGVEGLRIFPPELIAESLAAYESDFQEIMRQEAVVPVV